MEQLEFKLRPELSVIFPAYNEEENIHRSLTLFSKELEDIPFELIVVNDGSTDATSEQVHQFQNKNPELSIRLIEHEQNRGYGAALRSGFQASNGVWSFFTDADLQFSPSDFQSIWTERKNWDVVSGYRFPRKDPFLRSYNAKIWGKYIKLLLGISLRDLNCAFKLFRTSVIQSLSLHSEGALINAEIFALLKRKNIPVKEVPVSHFPRLAGEQTGADPLVILKALRESIGLRRKLP